MKNFAKIFTAIVVAFAAYSCIADATEDLGVQVGNGEVETTITLSFGEQSKVQLGEKAGEVYPLYWSEGDAIAVNGVASNELTGVGENATEAQFIVEGVSYPLNIVYPAPTVTEAEVAEEGEAVAVYPVVFPAVQQYVPGNVDPKAVVLYGYANEEPTIPVQLNHLTGVLQLNVKGAATLTSLTVNARSGNIAGTYNVDCATGDLTEVNASNIVTMTFGDGLVLGAEATPIYVAVPAGSHGAVWVTLHTATDKMTVKFDSNSKPVSAGKVREFKEFEYAPNTADEESEEFVIDGVDKLIEFATSKAANFFPFTKAVVTADIDMTGVEWTPIENFGAFEFDGGERTITGLTAPLFGTTSANIHHLTLANVDLNITDNGNSGAFARIIIGGSLRHCSATGASTINCAELTVGGSNDYTTSAHGGLVGFINGGTIDNCTNEIDITVQSLCNSEQNIKSAVGGIVGCYANNPTLTNLINKGDVQYTGTTQKGTLFLSGIAGRDTEGEGPSIAAMDNCTNEGFISNADGSVTTGAVNVAGIVGYLRSDEDITCTKLVNKGRFVANGSCAGVFAGGIASRYCSVNLTNCTNEATESCGIGSKASLTYAYVAGIAGIASSCTLNNCDNTITIICSKAITITSEKVGGQDGAVNLAGVVAVASDLTLENCDNTGIIRNKQLSRNTTATTFSRLAGICAHSTGDVAISYCTNSGGIEMEAKGDSATNNTDETVSGIAMGGIIASNTDKTALTIDYCSNGGDIVFNTKKVNDATTAVGGIIGYANSGAVVTNCTNTEEASLSGDGYSAKWAGMGGIVGISTRGGVKIKQCKNYGSITSAGVLKKDLKNEKLTNKRGIGYGGIVGISQLSEEISDCGNWGQITIKNTNPSNLYVGGVIGWVHTRNVTDPTGFAKTMKNLVNYANLTFGGNSKIYSAGGVIGHIMAYDTSAHYLHDVSYLKNYADLTFNVACTDGYSYAFGGLIGKVEAYSGNVVDATGTTECNLQNCEFYGNIATNDNETLKANLGIIMGCERNTNLLVAMNSKIGGYIGATIETETIPGEGYIDPDTEEWVETTPPTTVTKYTGGTALTAENIHTYLYKGGIEASVATADGYTILTEKPAVPAVQ